MTTKTSLEIFREARQLIEAGWTQFSAEEAGNYCLAGAVAKAAVGAAGEMYSNLEVQQLFLEIAKLLVLGYEPELNNACDQVWGFNDSSNKEDVLELLDRVIKEEETNAS